MPASVVSTSTGAIAGGNAVVPAPTSITNGNLLIAVQVQDNDAGAFTNLTAPAGWTLLADSSAVSTAAGYGKIWYKIASGESGSYTFGGSSGATNYARIFNITGQASGSASAGTPVWSRPAAAAATTFIAPTMSMSGAGIIFRGYNVMGGTITLTPPSGYTGTSTVDPGGYMNDLVAYKAGSASGATGTANATSTNSGNTNTQGYLTVTFGILDATSAVGATATPSALAITTTFPTRTVVATSSASATPANLAASASFPQLYMPMHLLRDDFSTKDTVKWIGYVTGQADVVGGQLVIPATTGYYNLYLNYTRSLVSSAASTRLVQRPNVGNGGTQTWFTLIDGSNRLDWQVIGNNIVAGYSVGGVNTDVAVLTYNDVDYRFLRFREAAGIVYWESSIDRQTWVVRGSVANPFDLRSLHVNYTAGYFGTEPSPGSAIFDDLNIVSRLVNPAPLAATATFPTATAGAGSVAKPSVLSGAASFPGRNVTIGTNANATPANLAGSATFPTPTKQSNSSATPSVLAGASTFPAPTGQSSTTAAPSVLAASSTFPTPALTRTAAASPSVLASAATFPTATASAGVSAGANPVVLQATTTFPTAMASGGTSGVAAPGAIQASTTFPAPSTSAGSTATAAPGALTGSAAFPGPALTAGKSALAAPVALSTGASFPAAGVTAGSAGSAAPTALTGAASFPAPAVSAASGGSASPGALSGSASFPAPVVRISKTASPATLESVSSFPAPTVLTQSSGGAQPGVLGGSASFPIPAVKADSRAVAATLSGATTFGAPVGKVTASPGTITVVTVFPSPAITVVRSATATPAVILGTATFPGSVVKTGEELFPRAKFVYPELMPVVQLVSRRVP